MRLATDVSSRPGHPCDGPLRFHPLTLLAEGEAGVVGRPDVDSYIVLPADGAALLRRLHDGDGTAEAAGWYAEQFGEPVDVDEFVGDLRELGFLQEDGGTVPGPPAPVR